MKDGFKHIKAHLVSISLRKKRLKKAVLSKVVDTHRNFISVPGESFRLVSNESGHYSSKLIGNTCTRPLLSLHVYMSPIISKSLECVWRLRRTRVGERVKWAIRDCMYMARWKTGNR